MPASPDGRVATDGSCFGCNSPNGDSAPTQQWGVWISRYAPAGTNPGYMWLPVPPPPAPPNYVRTTPASSGATDGAQANPVQFSSPGLGNTAPNAGQLITSTGNAGSTGNPDTDLKRTIKGQVPNGPVFTNPA